MPIPSTLAATIIDLAYGQEIRSMDDEYMKLTLESIDGFVESKVLGKFWVDFLPFLKYLPTWFPGASSVKYGARFRPLTEEMLDRPFREIQSGVVSGPFCYHSSAPQSLPLIKNKRPSMLRDILLRLQDEPNLERRSIQEQYAKQATGIAYAGKYSSSSPCRRPVLKPYPSCF